MREKDFLRLYVDLYREKGEKISSMKAAKGRRGSIWETIIESIWKEKKQIYKGSGKFELRESNPRRVVLPCKKKEDNSYIL